MSVDIATGPALTIGAPRVAFEIPDAQQISSLPFPVTSVGDRVLYVREPDSRTRTIHVRVSWFETLRRATDVR